MPIILSKPRSVDIERQKRPSGSNLSLDDNQADAGKDRHEELPSHSNIIKFVMLSVFLIMSSLALYLFTTPWSALGVLCLLGQVWSSQSLRALLALYGDRKAPSFRMLLLAHGLPLGFPLGYLLAAYEFSKLSWTSPLTVYCAFTALSAIKEALLSKLRFDYNQRASRDKDKHAQGLHQRSISKLARVLGALITWCVVLPLTVMLALFLYGYRMSLPAGLSLGPLLLTLSVTCGDNLKMVISSLTFILVTHPFDLGDQVYMDSVNNCFVEEINLFGTRLRRYDGLLLFVPNYVLAGKVLCNSRRAESGQAQRFDIVIPSSFEARSLNLLQREIRERLLTLEAEVGNVLVTGWAFNPDNDVVVSVQVWHRDSFQDGLLRSQRQNLIIEAIRTALAKVAMQGQGFCVDAMDGIIFTKGLRVEVINGLDRHPHDEQRHDSEAVQGVVGFQT